MPVPQQPVAGWKAGLVIIGTLVVVFVVLNLLGQRFGPDTRREPPPIITTTTP